ncbi:MAG: hypothetical protein ACRDMV_01915, partial [Streptosporangiales bacterium]
MLADTTVSDAGFGRLAVGVSLSGMDVSRTIDFQRSRSRPDLDGGAVDVLAAGGLVIRRPQGLLT